jgi:hypothetical protein
MKPLKADIGLSGHAPGTSKLRPGAADHPSALGTSDGRPLGERFCVVRPKETLFRLRVCPENRRHLSAACKRVPAEAACEILHKAFPRERCWRGRQPRETMQNGWPGGSRLPMRMLPKGHVPFTIVAAL